MWVERRRERSSIPAELCTDQDSSGTPNDMVSMPALRRCAATASPFGPAPITTVGSRGAPSRGTPGPEIARDASSKNPEETAVPPSSTNRATPSPGSKRRPKAACARAEARTQHSHRRPSRGCLARHCHQAVAQIGVRPPVEHARGRPSAGRGQPAEEVPAPRRRKVGPRADRERDRAVRPWIHVDRVPTAAGGLDQLELEQAPPTLDPSSRATTRRRRSVGALAVSE